MTIFSFAKAIKSYFLYNNNNNNNKSLYLSKSLDTTHVCLYMILEYICYVNYREC